MHLSPPVAYYGDGSVVIVSLFYVPPIVCWGSVFGLCFVMHYLKSPFLFYKSS